MASLTMASEADKHSEPEEYVIQSVPRPGLKREFAFAMKAQAEASADVPLSRLRQGPRPSYVESFPRVPPLRRAKTTPPPKKSSGNNSEPRKRGRPRKNPLPPPPPPEFFTGSASSMFLLPQEPGIWAYGSPSWTCQQENLMHPGSVEKSPLDFLYSGTSVASKDVTEESLFLAGHAKFPSLWDPFQKQNQFQITPNMFYGDSSSRSSGSVLNPESLEHPGNNSRTSNTSCLELHKSVFKGDFIPDGIELSYYVRGKIKAKGLKKGSVICCCCCNNDMSPSQFERHAGGAHRRKPYHNIYHPNGLSLHKLSVILSKVNVFDGESNDLCDKCGIGGGYLVTCDFCPKAFHQECLGMSTCVAKPWPCPCCLKEHLGRSVALAGRCVHAIKIPQTSFDVCVLCRQDDFTPGEEFDRRVVIICDQCEKEYHVGCLKDWGMVDFEEIPKGSWFCCQGCSKMHDALTRIVSHGSKQLRRSVSDITKMKIDGKGLNKHADVNVNFRLMKSKAIGGSKSLLSEAISIFHESFDPIKDSASSEDLIPLMVEGGHTRDQDFSGMYCAVLTLDSSVVSAATIRVFSTEVAELPLVATRREYKGKGYFQSLFHLIESLLHYLNVKLLVLPAAEEVVSMWTNKFGFIKISPGKLHQYTQGFPVVIFEAASMLYKTVQPASYEFSERFWSSDGITVSKSLHQEKIVQS